MSLNEAKRIPSSLTSVLLLLGAAAFVTVMFLGKTVDEKGYHIAPTEESGINGGALNLRNTGATEKQLIVETTNDSGTGTNMERRLDVFDSECVQCNDTPTKWMKMMQKDCSQMKENTLKKKCRIQNWVKKFCSQTCNNAGLAFEGFTCCPPPTFPPTTAAPTTTTTTTDAPTSHPTESPTNSPTYPVSYKLVTYDPTYAPTYSPTYSPTYYPTYSPTYYPTYSPTYSPTPKPSCPLYGPC